MEKYLMKYNVDGLLYLYIERSKSGHIDSMIKINGNNKLFRYDGETKERTFIKYRQPCMLAQRFQASESWVTVVGSGCNVWEQYDFPDKIATFSFDANGYTNLFTTSTGFTTQCSFVLGTKTQTKTVTSNVTIIPITRSCLSNSNLFMDTKIAKNARKNIHITESH